MARKSNERPRASEQKKDPATRIANTSKPPGQADNISEDAKFDEEKVTGLRMRHPNRYRNPNRP